MFNECEKRKTQWRHSKWELRRLKSSYVNVKIGKFISFYKKGETTSDSREKGNALVSCDPCMLLFIIHKPFALYSNQ